MNINKNIKTLFMTVTGLETIHSLSFTDSHTHLWIDTGKILHSGLSKIDDFKLIKRRLIDFKRAGGSLIVDCTPYGAGRNANILYELSKTSGVKIISVTGFHKKQYYSNDSPLWKMDKDQIINFFLDEIQNGCTEARSIRSIPGAIKLAFIGILEGQYRNLSLAAIEAAKKTGLPLLVHTEKGLDVEKLLDFFEENGMDLSMVLLCHMDKNNNSRLHKKLIKRGVYLEYDSFLRPKYDPENNVMPLLKDMILSGYGNRILIGSDIDTYAMWKDLEKSGGLGSFFKSIEEKLSDLQLKNNDIIPLTSLNSYDFFKYLR